MIPTGVPTQSPYKLQLWPAHLLLVAGCGVAALTTLYPSATRQYIWPWAPLLILVWLAPLAAALGRLAFRDAWTWPNALLCTGLALLTGATLISATLSPFASHSILRIWPTFAGVALFFWLHDWLAESADTTRTRAKCLTRGLTVFGVLLVHVSIVGSYWRNSGFIWSARNDFPFGHSIYNAGAMLLLLPWLTYAALKTKGVQRLGWSFATAAGLFALLTTSSRGGVIAAGIVVILAATGVLLRSTWSPKIKTSVVLCAIILLVLGVWSNPRLRELTHGQGWSAASQESNVQRRAMIEAGITLGSARPAIGWGPGTIPLAYPRVRHDLSGGVDSVLQLHNTPAQLWATLGSGGLLALLVLLAAFTRRLWQIARAPTHASSVLASAASLLGYGLFTLTDHQLDVPAMNALLVINAALFFIDERPPRSLGVARTTKWNTSLALIFILLFPLLLTGRDLLARFAYDQSLVLFDAGRTEEGFEFLEAAAQRAPYDPYYRHQAAGRLLTQRAQAKDKSEQARLTTQAIAELEKSLASGCLQEFAHFNLGWLRLETSEPARAIPHFLATVHEAPHRGGAYLGLGFALQGVGRETDAVRAFALEWINDPIAFAAPLWEWPEFAPLRPKISHEADALLAAIAAHHATARHVRALWNWWEKSTPAFPSDVNAETHAFAASLAAVAQNQPLPAAAVSYLSTALLHAWQQPLDTHALAALTQYDEPFAAALIRRATRHAPPDAHGFLTAGLENESALLSNTRFSRPGYGVLALHPDGPVLTNLYVLQQNRVVATFLSGLFPPKGWLTARELLTRLPAPPVQP